MHIMCNKMAMCHVCNRAITRCI